MRFSTHPVRLVILSLSMIFSIAIAPSFASAEELIEANQSNEQYSQVNPENETATTVTPVAEQPEAESNVIEPVSEPLPDEIINKDVEAVEDSTVVADSENTPEVTTPDPDLSIVNQTNLSNTLDSSAETGNALVTENGTAGDAISGNAESSATLLNNLNSVVCLDDNQSVAEFTADINGDVTGDIILQPIIEQTLETTTTSPPSSLAVNLVASDTITNNLNLTATSGNAEVSKNSEAGSAITGTAQTMANVINIVNSMVVAGKSFIGTINIYGTLTGDILISDDFISQLLSSNGAQAPQTGSSSMMIDADDAQIISNNISLTATSGSASMLNNSSAGNILTGDANTNLVIFNLSGHDVIASDSILVFVNVLGKWVGFIVDAAEGTTAAAVGNNIESSNMTIPDTTIISDRSTQITNNINLISQTGAATVVDNTTAGNAQTGDATASANIANIIGCEFGLTGWFGVLFINVFGNWFGSFGIDTPYGDVLGTTTVNDTVATTVKEITPLKTIAFVYVAKSDAEIVDAITAESDKIIEDFNSSFSLDNYGSVLSATDSMLNIPLLIELFIVLFASLVAMKRVFAARN